MFRSVARTIAAEKSNRGKKTLGRAANSMPAAKANPYDLADTGDDPAGKMLIAAKLTEMVGFRLNLEYQPNCYYFNEDGHSSAPSQGHIWSAFIDERQDDQIEDFGDSFHVTIDDRLGDVRLQFISELRRIGRVFEGMAQLVEREANAAEARYCKLGTYPTPPAK